MATSDAELGTGDSIGHFVQILLDCKEKGQDLGDQRLPSIYMVPSVCRDLSPKSFTPTVVSIGPLHRQDKNLQGHEVQKTNYLHRLLDRSGSSPEETLKQCAQKVMGKIEQIKARYAESPNYNDLEIAKMMVIDACFILYFIHLISEYDEPFPGNWLIASKIIDDLVLLENQIPFFVLEDIYESTILQFKPLTSLINHMQILLTWYNFFRDDITTRKVSLETTHDHILGLLHKSLRPARHIPSGSFINPKRHSAVELDRAGVNFMPNQDVNWALAMKVESAPRFSCFPWFWRKLTLEIPIFHIEDRTERVLRNLIIYEQSSRVPNYVTTFMWAMGMLVDTPQDVAKLVKSGVLSTISSDQNVFNMIYNICKEVLYADFLYHKEWQELDTYYNSYWPNAVAVLKRKYFSSPWNVIALFAGIVLFLLTVVQTIFTVKAAM